MMCSMPVSHQRLCRLPRCTINIYLNANRDRRREEKKKNEIENQFMIMQFMVCHSTWPPRFTRTRFLNSTFDMHNVCCMCCIMLFLLFFRRLPHHGTWNGCQFSSLRRKRRKQKWKCQTNRRETYFCLLNSVYSIAPLRQYNTTPPPHTHITSHILAQ